MNPLCFTVTDADELYIGVLTGIAKYDTYKDGTASFGLQYFSHPLSFGDSSRLKFLKAVNVTTFNGSAATVVLNWAYDYSGDFQKQAYTLETFTAGQYHIADYNTADGEYASSSQLINKEKVNTGGSGSIVAVGLTTTIDGQGIAFQELNIHSLIGRII
tara:strand:- start:794 stop:1270 length:477 start_codon:yes stop_codon:yes gene_type:complete